MPIRTKLFCVTEARLGVPDLADYIKELNVDHTRAEVASIIGVPCDTVYVWLVKLGINRSRSEAMRQAWQKEKWDRDASRQRAYETGFNKASQGRQCPWKGEQLPADWRENISLGINGRQVGPKNPMWRGGKTSRCGAGWKRAKRQALENAQHRCQACHRHESELERPLEVHHKIPLRYFERPSDAHSECNLIVLCRQCHKQQEMDIDRCLPLFKASEVACADEQPQPRSLRDCEICGKPYKPIRSSQKYCSRECTYVASTRRLRNLSRRPANTTICPVCGISFNANPYRLRHHQVVTCSRACAVEAVKSGLSKRNKK